MEISSRLPDVVDAYIAMRAQRLVKDKEAASLKEQEELLKVHLITELKAQGYSALGGANGSVKLKITPEPDPTDWVALQAHIQATGEFDLLHRRITSTAVKLRWDDGVEVPGVGRKDVATLTVSTK